MEFRDSLDSTLQQLHQLTVYDGVSEVKVHMFIVKTLSPNFLAIVTSSWVYTVVACSHVFTISVIRSTCVHIYKQ